MKKPTVYIMAFDAFKRPIKTPPIRRFQIGQLLYWIAMAVCIADGIFVNYCSR